MRRDRWCSSLVGALLFIGAMPVMAETPMVDPAMQDVDLITPAREPKACSASFECGDGNVAACTGSSSCQAYPLAVPAFVKCDGQRYYCPNMCFVTATCAPGNWIQCSSNVGDCQSGLDWVECDGDYYECGMRGGGPD
jgi:hypothetical protein